MRIPVIVIAAGALLVVAGVAAPPIRDHLAMERRLGELDGQGFLVLERTRMMRIGHTLYSGLWGREYAWCVNPSAGREADGLVSMPVGMIELQSYARWGLGAAMERSHVLIIDVASGKYAQVDPEAEARTRAAVVEVSTAPWSSPAPAVANALRAYRAIHPLGPSQIP
ncbi:MAG: hypothetical protein H0W72_04735 [Planctomycetes bacterium]|nr:hypothetical protein [Planctomycetota bacterium]